MSKNMVILVKKRKNKVKLTFVNNKNLLIYGQT